MSEQGTAPATTDAEESAATAPVTTSSEDRDALAMLAGTWAIDQQAWPRVVAGVRSGLRATADWPADTMEAEAPQMARRGGSSTPHAAGGAVGVISLSGVIRPKMSGLLALLFGMSGGLEMFQEQFMEAMNDGDIGSVVLNIDSPGGLTDLVPETAAMIREARGTKPIVAVANTMAASAAYYIASQADEVVVTPSGFIGSIGVFTVHEDWSAFNERVGIMPTYIHAGKYKVEGNPDEPLSAEAKKAMQVEVDEFYNMFVTDVAKGRSYNGRDVSVNDVRDGYGEGRTLTSKRAVKAGLADRVDTLNAVILGLLKGEGSSGSESGSQAADDKPPVTATDEQPKLTADDIFDPNHMKTLELLES